MHTQRNLSILIAAVGLIAVAAFAYAERSASLPISCSDSASGGFGCATEDTVLSARTGTAPDFTLPTLDGATLTLSYILAEKPVVLDFWASWCPHCQANMPNLDALYTDYGDRIEVIGVNMRESPEKARAFADRLDISYPIVLDAGDVASAYGIRYTNTHVLIRQDGTILKVLAGDIGAAELEELLVLP